MRRLVWLEPGEQRGQGRGDEVREITRSDRAVVVSHWKDLASTLSKTAAVGGFGASEGWSGYRLAGSLRLPMRTDSRRRQMGTQKPQEEGVIITQARGNCGLGGVVATDWCKQVRFCIPFEGRANRTPSHAVCF